MRRFALGIAALMIAACGSSTAPTPPPPTEDPPTVQCPAARTVELTTGASIAVPFSATAINGKAPVVVVCTPSSGSLFDVGVHTVSCTATDALARVSAPCTFAVTVLPPAVPPTLISTSLLAFGDSITWGEDGRNSATDVMATFLPRVRLPIQQTYPALLQQELAARYTTQTVIVDNGGQSGEAITDPATADTPSALTRFNRLLPGHGVVLIMEGTNDLPKAHIAANQTAQNDILATASAGLRQMVRDAKAAGARPYLGTIPPMNPTGSRGQTYGWDLVAGFNERVVSVAASEQVPLVDVNSAFAGNLNLLGPDGVHPTAAGYQVIAEAYFAAIKNTLESKPATAPLVRRR